jgi:hypothetical protein
VSINDADTRAVALVQQGHDTAVAPGSALLSGELLNSYISYSADADTQVVPSEIPPADVAVSNADFPFWPAETDLVFASGSNRLKLTSQTPIVRSVIVEGIENLRAAMLFTDTFPDVCSALTLIKDSLLTSASYLLPVSADVLDRLKVDPDYLSKVTLLVSLIYDEMTPLTTLYSHVPGSV